jgi:hypothetical protein
MEHQKGISLDEFIYRKLQPVRILVGFLNNELAVNEGDTLTFDRSDVDNIVSTMEIFLEEYDRVSQHRATRLSKKKKFADIAKQPAIKAIA